MPAKHFPDTYSASGAERLRSKLTAYWLAQGYTNVRVERFQLSPGTWGIRSNLVDGMPPVVPARIAA